MFVYSLFIENDICTTILNQIFSISLILTVVTSSLFSFLSIVFYQYKKRRRLSQNTHFFIGKIYQRWDLNPQPIHGCICYLFSFFCSVCALVA